VVKCVRKKTRPASEYCPRETRDNSDGAPTQAVLQAAKDNLNEMRGAPGR
jgi:hypothetical protein